ncbi:hypothetical protein V1477_001602 [Vespula maculifrons]|uniref:Uncharacterized protein n=1 Tax=Vespula maculifrons TaxID=7453 RepID=A0ABD2CYK5_VESMC
MPVVQFTVHHASHDTLFVMIHERRSRLAQRQIFRFRNIDGLFAIDFDVLGRQRREPADRFVVDDQNFLRRTTRRLTVSKPKLRRDQSTTLSRIARRYRGESVEGKVRALLKAALRPAAKHASLQNCPKALTIPQESGFVLPGSHVSPIRPHQEQDITLCPTSVISSVTCHDAEKITCQDRSFHIDIFDNSPGLLEVESL